jgi:hypothetical protein
MSPLTGRRLVDIMPAMSTRKDQREHKSTRQILGFSLAPDMARAVKAEAARRGVSLRKLFEEMWSEYEKKKPKA